MPCVLCFKICRTLVESGKVCSSFYRVGLCETLGKGLVCPMRGRPRVSLPPLEFLDPCVLCNYPILGSNHRPVWQPEMQNKQLCVFLFFRVLVGFYSRRHWIRVFGGFGFARSPGSGYGLEPSSTAGVSRPSTAPGGNRSPALVVKPMATWHRELFGDLWGCVCVCFACLRGSTILLHPIT